MRRLRRMVRSGVADYISDLRAQVLAAVDRKQHQAIVFHDLDEVPVGSVGYFSPSEARPPRRERLVPRGPALRPGSAPASPSPRSPGPRTTRCSPSLIEEALVPKGHLLVDLEASTEHEPADWEGSQPAYDYAVLGSRGSSRTGSPSRISPASTSRSRQAPSASRTSTATSRSGSASLGEDAAMAVRDKAAANRHEWLQLDDEDRRDGP